MLNCFIAKIVGGTLRRGKVPMVAHQYHFRWEARGTGTQPLVRSMNILRDVEFLGLNIGDLGLGHSRESRLH